MTGGFNDPLVGGGGALVYPSIHSPNFVTGVSGWTINKNGSAEFSNITVRGSVIIKGTTGEFTYDAAGNLRSANVGQVTTDPVQGITCQQGFSTFNGHGAVINLLSTANGAFFQYADNGSAVQGALILSTASVAGTDPVTSTSYPAGQQGINPVFGSFTQLLGSAIIFGVASIFSRNASVGVTTGSGASPPYLETDSPEQTTASHALLRLQGKSPDGTKPAQALIAAVAGSGAITRATNALLEVQGDLSQLAMSNITGTSFSNSAAETTIGTFIIPANDAQSGGTTIYDLTAHGNVQCSSASNLTLRLRITGPAGTLILATATFACQVAAGTNRDWTADFKLAFRGSGNTNMDVWGQFLETISVAGGVSTVRSAIAPFTAVNNTSAVVIAVTAQFSAANAGNSASGINGSLDRRNN